jgi:signal transduction histidine kinase
MGSQAIGILERMAGGVSGLTSSAPVAPAVPAQHTLDADLRDQRLRVVWFYSFGLGVVGTLWVAFWLVAHARGWLGEPASDGPRLAATVLQAGVLGAAGWYALYRCQRGRLRRATYTNVSALALSATINLAFISNAEGAAVMIFAIAASLAALVIEGREWLWWGGILAFSALLGSLLHSFPSAPLVELPPTVATASLISATSLGLAVPMALMWLFSGNLTASREEAWALARKAADANRLATERARQLEERTAQLQAKNAELNDFLYVVSHDLRAPLINLEGFSRALQDSVGALDGALETDATARPARWPELRGEIEESLDFIVRSVRKMDFLVQGLLELSRIDSRPNLTEQVDIARLVDEIVDSLRYKIDERAIAVRVDPLPVVTGDAVRINQVFGNLIDNAVKYMAPSGEASIHVGCDTRNGTPQFFVRDTGIGIRPEDQAKIFRLFSRVGGHSVPGDGMGLTAVKKILEKHGGRIWVDSAPGKGSTFWFTLPGRDTDEEREEA